MHHSSHLSRRRFLWGAGGIGLMLPWLPSLVPEPARAATPPAKRFVSIRSSQGPSNPSFFPNPSGVPTNALAPNVVAYDLDAIAGELSPVFGSSFDGLRNKLLFLKRLDPLISAEGHNSGVMLGAFNDDHDKSTDPVGYTIDQVIAKHVYGGPHAHPYVNLVAYNSVYINAMHSWGNVSGGIGRLNGVNDPRVLFDQLFLGFDPSGGSAAFDKQQARDLLVVDRVLPEYQALRGSPRVSAADAERLDAHIQFIHELESRINSSTFVACSPPAAPPSRGNDSLQPADIEAFTKTMLELMVAAIKCNATSVLNLNITFGGYTFLPGVTSSHHSLAHQSTSSATSQINTLDRWIADQVAYFLTLLDAEIDPLNGRTYLDNCVVFYSKELANIGTHPNMSAPVLLAGSCDGFFKMGMLVDYASPHPVNGYRQYYGRAYNELLITLMLAMGLEPDQWESNGQPGFGTYTHTAATPASLTLVGDQRSPLPGIV